MKRLLILLFAIFATSAIAQESNKITKKEKRKAEQLKQANEIEDIVKSKLFIYEPNKFFSATSQSNTSVYGTNLKGPNSSGLSGYYVKVSETGVDVYLPYVGKSNKATLEGGAIEFKSDRYTVEYAPKVVISEGWLIGLKVTDKTRNVVYDMLIDIDNDGTAFLNCDMSGAESIRFEGALSKL